MTTFRPVPKPAKREKAPRPPKVRKPLRGGPPRVRDRAYLDWIKTLNCAVRFGDWGSKGSFCGYHPPGRAGIEAAHVKTRGSGGADRGNVVPLCPLHHDEQEGDTEGFERVYGVNLKLEAARLLVRFIEEGHD